MKALTYSRVSTSHHDQKPEIQTEELRRYCAARNWQLTEEIIDHGFSGGTEQRPGLKRLMALVRSRKVDVVIVTKMDRLFRSLKHLVATLDEFSAVGVLFVSVGDQIDLGTASGRLMLHIVAAFGEFERAMVRERTMLGIQFARSQGKTLGRPKTRPDANILRLRAQGHSYSQIQRQLGISRSAIHRALVAVGGTKSSKNLTQKTQLNRGGHHA